MKKEIKNINFQLFINCEDMELLAKQLNLQQPWILPQIQAYIAEHWKPQLVGELYSPYETLHNLDDKWSRGLYLALQKLKRGTWVGKQNSGDGLYYCALVPLILNSYKKYLNIPYSMWMPEQLQYIVDKPLCEAMLSEPPQLDVEELLEIREQGLTTATGPKAGEMKNPLSTWRLFNIQNTALGKLPPLAQTQLCQIWCAHPQLRNMHMVLDPTCWDLMPKALISDEILQTGIKKLAKTGNNRHDRDGLGSDYTLPWDVK